jgi:hypothetical protein
MATLASEFTVNRGVLPWIEVVEGESPSGHSPSTAASAPARKARALFAARVRPLPQEQREAWKWGFSNDHARQEAMARQQQFLAGLHDGGQFEFKQPPPGPVLALHLLRDPANEGLALCLLGAVDGGYALEAREQAIDLWRTVVAAFPYDYEVAPVLSPEEFYELSGLGLLDQIKAESEIVEVRRFEAPLSTGHGPGLLLGSWQGHDRADEQIWRALAIAPQATLLTIRIQPTYITTAEWPRIQAALNLAPGATETESPLLRQHYRWAANLYEKRLSAWVRPFLLQVHLVAIGGVPTYLRRALGTAITWKREGDAQPAYQTVAPPDKSVLDNWRHTVRRLSFTTTPPAADNNLLCRLHLLAGIEEASTVFHWPYPPKGGLPGVDFL